jgi:hypothetical protein
MRQHIDTIPLWDAYKSDCECPLCKIRSQNEAMYVENFLGASVMEPDTRVEVNEKGYCPHHFQMMFDAGNRLGLALMTHTYLKETMKKIDTFSKEALTAAAEQASKPLSARLMSKISAKKEDALSAASSKIEKTTHTCILCERLDATMERYLYTLLYLWKKESEFRRAFESSKGLCLPHYAQLLQMAKEELSGQELKDFVQTLTQLMHDNLERIEKELEWFTLKFDYRNQDKPWGNSQDAVERSINKLRGHTVEG